MCTPFASSTSPAISVIMPAYNEGGHIYGNIAETLNTLIDAGYDAEIVVVDDGSTDTTLTEIERAAAAFGNVVTARNPYNMGKGMALRTGFDHARGDIIVFLDADLDLHPSQIHRLMDELASGCDVVVTSKHHPESNLAYPFARMVASLGYYVIIKLLFGLPLRDTQTGLKVFRREVLDHVFHRLLVKRYAYDVELLATAIRFGYRVHEMPVVLDYKRQMTWGRIRPGDVLSIFADTLAILYRLRLLKYYDIERPRPTETDEPVLVVTRSVPPTDAVFQRLSLDTNTQIASVGVISDSEETSCNTLTFCNEQELRIWLDGKGSAIRYVGFLGPGCTPLGSWVKNALRNFAENTVMAVCGPVVPSPAKSTRSLAAAMLFSSALSAGPNHYLRSITRVKEVSRGTMDNIFIRAELLRSGNDTESVFMRTDGMLIDPSPARNMLRYDPDVAVSRPVPGLFIPYLRQVFREATATGHRFFNTYQENNRIWILAPLAGVLVAAALILGILPPPFSAMLLWGYATAVLFNGLQYLAPQALPLFIIGIVFEHLIRAAALTKGIVGRIIGKLFTYTDNQQTLDV